MDSDDTLHTIRKYIVELTPADQVNFNIDMIMELLDIVLRFNIFMFGDLYFCQTKDIAMGTCCAVMVANIYVAYHERTKILRKYKDNAVSYKRFIDDVFTLWIDGNNGLTTKDLEKDLHQCDLPWTFTETS